MVASGLDSSPVGVAAFMSHQGWSGLDRTPSNSSWRLIMMVER